MEEAGRKKFSELKDSTRKEIAELIISEGYKPLKGVEDIQIDAKKDFSDFSGLKDKTKSEIAELIVADSYRPSSDSEQMSAEKFDGVRIVRIQEFLEGERKKMDIFLSQADRQEIREREFADRELMRKNLGLEQQVSPEPQKRAEPMIAFSEREKRIADYIQGAANASEQLKRVGEIAGSEDIKAIMLKALKINKDYSPF